ncbi:putative late blight resistance protein homolog R1A-10 isoform X2 [Salvia hispanica]|uniref:putative late blight resistance protein homolog R1A-10 isoform X2 n=1 Tax=Salvia hispanica TaxID=49212 RepID=UPI00200906CB|nr:putative late blight resistance protein homolog R1A-10 isoform X2 [Salvia hispanica]
MAAYAALISLMRVIDDIETHPFPPIFLDKQQVESLTEKLVFLQEFLESYNSPYAYSDEADPLEMRIVDAAQAAEDVIESYIIDTIHISAAATDDGASGGGDGEQISCIHFYQDLQNVIEEVDMIKKEVTGITREKVVHQRNVADLRSSSSTEKKHLMVGFDDVLLQLLDRLTDGNTNRQIIPIVGMGGIGKTTLAKGGSSSSMDEKELVVKLYQYLWGRRYLIILDDMWSIDVWDKLKFSFPDCCNSSRILVTTRMSNLAAHLTDSYNVFKMGFLDEASSWTLFSKTVFGEQGFPTQLKSIGKKIVEKCKGLPLAIAVIGGLMAKSEPTVEYWEHIKENISSIVNSENDDYCLTILKLSYNYLPIYLKPCFLYMGVFEEDRVLSALEIVELWESEGFLKPLDNKSMVTIAKEYLQELVDRNLILVHELGLLGNVKSCKIHDLLRDLSMKEAQKQRFFYVLREESPVGVMRQHRIVIPRSTSKEKIVNAFESMSHVRSCLLWCDFIRVLELPKSRFLRTLHALRLYPKRSTPKPVNSRYLAFRSVAFHLQTSIKFLWNLHTLIIFCEGDSMGRIDIWKMLKLRHVEFYDRMMHLRAPPSADDDIIVMKHLEVLGGVKNLNLSEDVIQRIPNIKKLSIIVRVNYLSCLQCLTKLESLSLSVYSTNKGRYVQKMSFPDSLKKLNLDLPIGFEWEDILPMIGALPLLHKLTLRGGRFKEGEWETTEGQFPSLRSLNLVVCQDLENWTVSESSHFPFLQELRLCKMKNLKEIPLEIGEIPTLRSIELYHCNELLVFSAKEILKEQEDLQGDQPDLHVRVEVKKKDKALQRLASSNFEVVVSIF